MTTPTPRTPVRLARGLKVNLDTGLAAGDIKEGELVYAKDEDRLYMVEGGVFVSLGADISTSSIDDLSDVDTSTVAPTDGQVLTWDNATGQWEPADAAGGTGTGDGSARGDGGDFNTGTVDVTFALGVYGGGNFNTGTSDNPAELLNSNEGPDGGSF